MKIGGNMAHKHTLEELQFRRNLLAERPTDCAAIIRKLDREIRNLKNS